MAVREPHSARNSHINKVLANVGRGPDCKMIISYTGAKIIGHGTFGVVSKARLCGTLQPIAIKKVLQDKRYKNRELGTTRRLDHCNIVELLYFFFSNDKNRNEVYLNLVFEYLPMTLYDAAHQYYNSVLPLFYTRLYTYQMYRGLAYMHSLGVCHRDIKSENLLLDPARSILKICDFGSAKQLVAGESNVSYISSRYYRAPELVLGATEYTTQIDMWSAGCVLAELLLGKQLFRGDSGVDQLIEIIKILGTPTKREFFEMNSNYTDFSFPDVRNYPWQKVFRLRTSKEAVDLISHLLVYIPHKRLNPLQACAHLFYDRLREQSNKSVMPDGHAMPPLFNFTEQELSLAPELKESLIPKPITDNSISGENFDQININGDTAPASYDVASTDTASEYVVNDSSVEFIGESYQAATNSNENLPEINLGSGDAVIEKTSLNTSN